MVQSQTASGRTYRVRSHAFLVLVMRIACTDICYLTLLLVEIRIAWAGQDLQNAHRDVFADLLIPKGGLKMQVSN